LFFQGDAPRGVYEILSGTVIQYKVMADGRRQIQSFASEGDFLAMTFSDIHDLSAEALTDVEVLFVPRSAFDHRLQEQSGFRRSVFTLISQLLQDAREQALLLGRKNAMERTASFLIFLDNRFCDPATGFAAIRMSRCDIADYLGLTLETVSRMMNKLKKTGIIDLPQPNTFRVLNRSRLIALAGEIPEEAFLAA
jgi:CRP/FNR family transcriptional regulator